jgi:sec-independent protein translocase protein TatA
LAPAVAGGVVMLLSFMGPIQIAIVLLIALLLFGTRLPSIARAFGQSITEFKKGIKEVEDHSNDPQK